MLNLFTGEFSDPSLFAERTSTPNPWRWRIPSPQREHRRRVAGMRRDPLQVPATLAQMRARAGGRSLSNVGPLAYVLRQLLLPRRPSTSSHYWRWFRICQRKPRPPLASRERARALLTVADVCWEAVAAPSANTQKKEPRATRAAELRAHADPCIVPFKRG